MKVNAISQVTPFTGVFKTETKKVGVENQTNPIKKSPMPSAETLQAMVGVRPTKLPVAKPVPVAHTNYEASKLIKEAGVMLSKEDFKNVKKADVNNYKYRFFCDDWEKSTFKGRSRML